MQLWEIMAVSIILLISIGIVLRNLIYRLIFKKKKSCSCSSCADGYSCCEKK